MHGVPRGRRQLRRGLLVRRVRWRATRTDSPFQILQDRNSGAAAEPVAGSCAAARAAVRHDCSGSDALAQAVGTRVQPSRTAGTTAGPALRREAFAQSAAAALYAIASGTFRSRAATEFEGFFSCHASGTNCR